ncbi:MAG: ABC transporter permease [Candidatus Vecturithrix sp.]|jgi:ribose/xylose/arabinose/galactoside ABC-type transport system permease subunit|nr:ABC transporter permease [Candidatus Vecturithrix sp.]
MKLRISDPTIKFLLIILIILVLGFEVIIPGQRFFKFSTFQSMAFQVPELGILALAMMIAMLSGGINLSIIATTNMTALITACILTRFISESTGATGSALIMITAIAAGLVMALLVGTVNGLIIAYIGVSPILTTLGTMTVVEGLNVALTRGDVISGFPEPILFLGNGVILGVPVPLLIFAACAGIVAILLNRTPFGISVYMLGSNEKATLFSGIQTPKVLVKVYALSGLLCGVSAIIMIARFNSANAGYASSYLLVTILATVLGGVNPDGGFGKIFGLVLSLIVLQVISSGLNLLGFSAHLTIALWGGILIVVISLHHLRGWLSKATA